MHIERNLLTSWKASYKPFEVGCVLWPIASTFSEAKLLVVQSTPELLSRTSIDSRANEKGRCIDCKVGCEL